MSEEARQTATLVVAIWGAVTGTAALWLRIRDSTRDRSELRVRARFHYEYTDSNFPPKVRLVVSIANVGRRPATIDQVFGVAEAPNFWRAVQRCWKRAGRIPLERHVQGHSTSPEVTEGQEHEFSYSDTGFTNIGLHDLLRIEVRDKHGRWWRSPRDFGQQGVRDILNAELVSEEMLGREGGRFVRLRLFRIGKQWRLFWRVGTGNRSMSSSRVYAKRTDADADLATFTERGRLFLAGDLGLDEFQQF